jgi:hypothetical protein
MHCMIAWGSPDASTPLTLDEHQKIERVLKGHKFLQVFPGAGVLTIETDEQRLGIEQELTAVIKAGSLGRIHVLISPPMGPGQIYRGFLKKAFWERLNEISS